MELTDLHDSLRSALDLLAPDAVDKQLQVEVRLAAADSQVMGDPTRLQQIFWNLIRNAIKFTPDGGRISVSTFNVERSVRVEVSDNGIGIDPARLSAIFDAFEQGNPDVGTRFGGLGLGLAICQALSERTAASSKPRAPVKTRGRPSRFASPLTQTWPRPQMFPRTRPAQSNN